MARSNVRGICFGLAFVLSVSAAVLGANAATADSIQYQSYQRASQSEACAAQPGETPWQANWGTDSSWKPSWEQWANAGMGGWTCTRSITWARTPVAGASDPYAVGSVGPGGGLVFLIDSGVHYEMAPKTWSAGGVNETIGVSYCDGFTDIPAANATAVGAGATNTAAMVASVACDSNAAAALLAYAPAGTSAGEWFLPSKDELNAMCNYSRDPATPPTGACTGAQNGAFALGDYGFAGSGFYYWSSTQDDGVLSYSRNLAWSQTFFTGVQTTGLNKPTQLLLRPIRAF